MTSDDQRHVAAFLEMMTAEKGASANTLEAYRRDLQDYTAYLAQAGVALAGAQKADVSRYLQGLSVAGLKPASRARRLSAVRQLYKFLEAEGAVGKARPPASRRPRNAEPCRRRFRWTRWTA